MGKTIPQIDDPAAIPTAVGLMDMSSSVLDSSSRATSHASRSSRATTVLSKDIKKQKAVYKKRIRQLHSVLVELKDSRITSEKMLRNIRQEVALLKTQQHTSEQMELIEARNKILVLEKENTALRRILVQQQDELQKYEEQEKGKEELQDLLHSVTLKDGSIEFVNAAVKDEFRRMKKKINGVIRQCNRLKEGIPIEKKPRKGYNRAAEMNASAAYSHSPPLSAVKKTVDPQEIQWQGHGTQTNRQMSRTPTRQHMVIEDRVMEDRVMEDQEDNAALEQHVLEEEEEEEEEEEVYAAPKPTVDHKVPGWFLQESPAEAWRRRKEVEKKKKASGAPAGRHPGQPIASGPAPPGMTKAPRFSVPFPEKDAGVPEFMRRFQQIGMKGREAVVESAGKIDTSSGDVKVTRGGIMYSGAAAAKRAEEERLAREEQDEREMDEQAQKDYEARMRYEEEAQAARRRREEEEARRKEEEERRQREEEERRRREEEEERRRKEESKSQEEKDREEREKAEREAKEKAEREEKEKAEREAKEKAEREAREKAEREAKEKEEQAKKAPPKKKSSFLDSSSSDSDSSTFPPPRMAAAAGGKKKKSFFDDSSSDDSS